MYAWHFKFYSFAQLVSHDPWIPPLGHRARFLFSATHKSRRNVSSLRMASVMASSQIKMFDMRKFYNKSNAMQCVYDFHRLYVYCTHTQCTDTLRTEKDIKDSSFSNAFHFYFKKIYLFVGCAEIFSDFYPFMLIWI